jgi:hypothetical protein
MTRRSAFRVGRLILIVLGAMVLSSSLLSLPAGAGGALQLVFTVQPSHTTAGQVISPAVKVAVEDKKGAIVTSKVYAIAIVIKPNTGPGTLWGTATVNTVAGIATFDDLIIDSAGSSYTLRASNKSTGSWDSTAFAISGVATQCRVSPCDLTSGTTTASNPTNGFASVPIASCGAAQCPFLSQDVVTPIQCGDQPCLNNSGMAVFPPSNATGVVIFTLQNYYTPTSGGIGNRPTYLTKFDGTVIELPRCPNPPGNQACVLKDSSSNGAVIQTMVQFPPTDPIVHH